jgi:tRNA/tmRNA/rRNA uracil-C5-methylase (TrmA/RlmC/RlmD family)
MKRAIVVDAFRRIGRLDVEALLEGPDTSGPEFGYRRRIRLSLDPTGGPGLLRRSSHDVVPIDDCLLMVEPFRETVLPWLRLTPPWKRTGVRLDSQGDSVILFETGSPPNEKDRRRFGNITKDMERPPSIRGLLADGVPLGGDRDLRFVVRDRELRADGTSFFQGNEAGTEELVHTVHEFLGDDREGTFVDLYAGVGLFGATVADGFASVLAVESDQRAARHLKHNLKRWGPRATIRAESAEMTLRNVAKTGRETVVLDPPRVGLSKDARTLLAARESERIVSVSCDPATAARDAAAFVEGGWTLKKLRAIDMFPVTAHVETVALLARDEG